MVYEWKQDRFGADAQRVGEELESIEYKDAESVVKAARKSRGELHKCFEWDDAVAGDHYVVRLALGDTRCNGANTDFSHQLDTDRAVRGDILQIVNQLRQVFNGVNIMVWRW